MDKKSLDRTERKKDDDKPKPESFRTKRYGPRLIVKKVKVAPLPDDVTNARQAAEQKLAGNTVVPSNDVLEILETLPPEALQSLKLATARRRKPASGRPKPKPRQSSAGGDSDHGRIADRASHGSTGIPMVVKPSPDGGDASAEPSPGITMDRGPMVAKPSPDGGDASAEPSPGITMDRGPIASKIVFMSKPPPEEPKPEGKKSEGGSSEHLSPRDSLPLLFFDDDNDHLIGSKPEDAEVERRVNDIIQEHRDATLQKLKNHVKKKKPDYTIAELIKLLIECGVPIPTNEDFGLLCGSESRWDPDGSVLEYFSPVMRSFIPVNMRGRYRGTWPSDTATKGLNLSKVAPKHDALEGFVDRGIHENIQEKYDDFADVAVDEAHLDYLIEMSAIQAETLPIPIFYDMLHLGMQVTNESLQILVQDQGYPPNNPIFRSQLQHAEQLKRKIKLYASLGLETIDSKTRGFGTYLSQWLKNREDILLDILYWKSVERHQKLHKDQGEAEEMEEARRVNDMAIELEEQWGTRPSLKKQ